MSIDIQILEYLKAANEASINELSEHIPVSRQFLHRIIKKLVQENYLQKLGTAPKVFYKLIPGSLVREEELPLINNDDQNFLDEHFLVITETGNKLSGVPAMQYWCKRQKLPLEKTIREFINTRKRYLQYYLPNGLIDGTKKIKTTKGFSVIGIDKMFYCDFYAIERFGKTPLGILLHFAKQGQSRLLMNEIISAIKEKIDRFIEAENFDAAGFIPPTIKRQLQFMTVLKKGLNLSLPHLNLIKVSGPIPVPQKALNKIEDRIINAQSSIMLKETRKFNKILLIDDAVGSGATINETAIKLKSKGIAQSVIGLAITGSYKGFDVIQEV